jgi:glycosyltransferase involved in cell wall biosynthesis
VADAMKQLLVENNVAPQDKCVTIYSGMEMEPFLASHVYREQARRQLGYSSEQVVIGKIARLFPLKGHEDLIRAAAKVVSVCPQARFLCVGGGILEEALKKQISRAGLQEYFQFTGLVPPERLPYVLSAMDIVVHTSLREGLARVLPQALLAGKPVISYDIDGAREVVLPERTGILLPPRDIDGLAQAILRLAGDAALRERLALTGRAWCQERFSHEKMTREIRELYVRLLRAKGYLPERVSQSLGQPVGEEV